MHTLRSNTRHRLGLVLVLVWATAVAAPAAAAGGRPRSTSPATPGAAATPGAVSVRDHGALGKGSGDDTAAFVAAMAAARTAGSVRYPSGPGGAAQGVVYVPPGTYRLLNLTFPSDLRMEVDAGAVLEQAGGRNARAPAEYPSPAPSLILWDGPAGAPLRNVSLVGVGSSTGGVKSLAGPVPPGWSVANDFTFDVDPKATDANNLVSGLLAMNVDGFLVANVLSVQNDSQPQAAPSSDADWWPSSRKAVLGLRARNDSPVDRSEIYDPHHGTVANWFNVHSPKGFGPNQVNSAHDVTLSHVFTRGGTALRLETDNSTQVSFGSEVRGFRADDIAAESCNRGVAFAPHYQLNVDVHVSKVRTTACYQGVVQAADEGIAAARRGAFVDSTISDVVVTGGSGAQVPTGQGRWTSGTSHQAFARDKQDTWDVVFTAGSFACRGRFTRLPDPVRTTDGVFRPACSP